MNQAPNAAPSPEPPQPALRDPRPDPSRRQRTALIMLDGAVFLWSATLGWISARQLSLDLPYFQYPTWLGLALVSLVCTPYGKPRTEQGQRCRDWAFGAFLTAVAAPLIAAPLIYTDLGRYELGPRILSLVVAAGVGGSAIIAGVLLLHLRGRRRDQYWFAVLVAIGVPALYPEFALDLGSIHITGPILQWAAIIGFVRLHRRIWRAAEPSVEAATKNAEGPSFRPFGP